MSENFKSSKYNFINYKRADHVFHFYNESDTHLKKPNSVIVWETSMEKYADFSQELSITVYKNFSDCLWFYLISVICKIAWISPMHFLKSLEEYALIWHSFI